VRREKTDMANPFRLAGCNTKIRKDVTMSDTVTNPFAEALEHHERIGTFSGMLVRVGSKPWVSFRIERPDGPLRLALTTEEAANLHRMLGSMLAETVDERTQPAN